MNISEDREDLEAYISRAEDQIGIQRKTNPDAAARTASHVRSIADRVALPTKVAAEDVKLLRDKRKILIEKARLEEEAGLDWFDRIYGRR